MTDTQTHILLGILLLLVALSTVARAAGEKQADLQDMQDIEYHYQLIPTGALTESGNQLSGTFLNKTAFIDWENSPSSKEGFYIDTVDRFLKSRNKVLRVRFDLSKPAKSKITLKSRNAELSKLDKMSNEAEGEIDAFFGRETYSYSLDTKIPVNQFDASNMTLEDTFSLLKSSGSEIYPLTRALRESRQPLMKTGTMRMAKFKGTVNSGEHEGMKVEVQVWTVKGSKTPVLAEIGFDGDVADREILDARDAWLSRKLQSDNLLAKDAGASKTEITFAVSARN